MPNNHDSKLTLGRRSAFKGSFTRVTLTTVVPVNGRLAPALRSYRALNTPFAPPKHLPIAQASYLKTVLTIERYGFVKFNAKLDLHPFFYRALRLDLPRGYKTTPTETPVLTLRLAVKD